MPGVRPNRCPALLLKGERNPVAFRKAEHLCPYCGVVMYETGGGVNKSYEEMADDVETWANVTRQLRLQRALLEDGEALGRFLTLVVVDEVDSRLDSRLGEVFGVGGMWGEEDILGTVFPRLDEEDAEFYRELVEGEVLHENIEALSRSLRAVWKSATLEEVRTVAEGVIADKGESDNLM